MAIATVSRVKTTHKTMRLIHYGGVGEFRPNDFIPIKDTHWIKPEGGFWASPVDAVEGWEWWCRNNNFRIECLDSWFNVDFTGNVFTIDSADDLNRMEWVGRGFMAHPSFEALVEICVDAIHLTARGELETRYVGKGFYGWDCETVLVMNPKCVTNINDKNNKDTKP